MALSVKSGSVTLNTSTGNQAVTGVGFQPTLLLFWGGLASDGAHAKMTFGAAMSSSSRWAVGIHSEDNAAAANTARSASASLCMVIPDVGGASADLTVDLVSMDADGFTVNITATDAGTYKIHYLALAHADLEFYIGTFDLESGTGNESVTGVGFTPKLTIFSSVGAAIGNNTAGLWTLGAAASSSAQWGMCFYDADGSDPTAVNSTQITTALHRLATSSDLDVATFVSNDADGFTVNKTSKDGDTTRMIGFICIGGDCNVGVGTFTEPATATTKTVTPGFRPECMLFASWNAAASSSISSSQCTASLGVAVSASDQRGYGWNCTDNAATSETTSVTDEDDCIVAGTGNTPTRTSVGELTSFDASGATLTFATVTTNLNQIGYIALSGPIEASFTSTGAATGEMAAAMIRQPTAASTGAMTGAMAATQISDRTFASTGAMTGAMAAALIRDTEFESTGAMTGTMTAIATLLAEFSSTAHMMNFFARDNAEFDVWAVTLDPGNDGAKRYAAYPFTNFDFNSFATLDGLTFAAGDGGTYVLGSADDDGTDIDAFLQTGKSNMGTDRDKRHVVAYVIGTAEAPVMLEVEDGSGNTYEYEARTSAPDEPRRTKVKLGRGMKGGLWGWKIKNQDGSDFDIADLMTPPIALSRRID